MHGKGYIYGALSVLCVLLSVLCAYWPMALLGLCVAIASGRWLLALSVGAILDTLYGPPFGILHIVQFPFLLLAFALLVGVQLVATQLRQDFPNRL